MSYETGRRFQPFTFVVDQAKVQEICQALHDPNPIYRDAAAARAAGYARIPAPPTFLNSSIQTLIIGVNPVDSLGISRRRALHAGQDYEYHAMPCVGDRLTGQTTLTEVTRKSGRSGDIVFLTLETRFTRDDELVAVVRNRVAERLGRRDDGPGPSSTASAETSPGSSAGTASGAASGAASGPILAPSSAALADGDAPDSPNASEGVRDPVIASAAQARALADNHTLRPRSFSPTRVDIAWYMVASYDLNPIHVDEPFARAAGFPSVIGQAMIPMGHLAAGLVDAAGLARLRALRGDFVRPVFPDEILHLHARLAGRDEQAGGVSLTWRLNATGPEGQDRVRGEAVTWHGD
ncbi:MAG: MaoC family dehydratase N-terminal domain-containing protein [Burkholderiaceae bacterium]